MPDLSIGKPFAALRVLNDDFWFVCTGRAYLANKEKNVVRSEIMFIV